MKWLLYSTCILLFSTPIFGASITISGTLYSDEGITPVTTADQTIHLVIDGVSMGTDVIDASGNYAITTTLTPANLSLLVYIDNGTIKGTTVTLMDSVLSSSLTNFDIYANHLVLRQDGSNAPLDTGDMHNAKGALSNPDILYTISWPNITVTGSNTKLYIANGYTYEPTGNVTTHHLQIEGTLNASDKTFNVSGNWKIVNGTFSYGTSMVLFTGSGSIDLSHLPLPWYSDSKAFYNVTMASTGQTIHLERGLNVTNILTLGTGTVTGGEMLLTKNGGTPLVTAGATLLNFSVRYNTLSNAINVASTTYRTLWLSSRSSSITFTLLGDISCIKLWLMGSGGKESVLDVGNQAITCDQIEVGFNSLLNRYGKLRLNNSTINVKNLNIHLSDSGGTNQIIASNATINISGDWTNKDTYIPNTSNVIFNGSSNQNLLSGGDPFYNLSLNNVGASLTLQDPLTVNNDLTVASGKLDTSSTNNQPITVLRHFNQHSTGEVEANASVITVGGDFNVDGTLDSTNYNNASVILNGAGSLLYANIFQRWRNGFNNLTVGQTGQTTNSSYTFAILNELTVGSGAFTGGAFVYLGSGSSNATLNLNPNATISIHELRFFGANQIIPSLPNGYDSNIRLSRNNLTLTQTGNITLNAGNHLLIDGDGFVNRSLTYNTNGFDLNIGGNLILGAGSDTALKTLNISNSTVTVAGNIDIRTGTNALISTNSNTTLNGLSAQSITTNGKAFDALTISNASAVGVTFNDGFTVNTLTNTSPNSKMTFTSGETYTINNSVNLQGATNQPVTLSPSTIGSRWNFVLNSGVSKILDYLDVSWSDASSSDASQKPINPNNTVRSGNNIDWFPAPLNVIKSSLLISDPINGTGANKGRIPGAIIEYRIVTQNPEDYSPDANTVVLYDVLDPNVEFDVTTGVTFSDGTNSSGLSLGTVRYSHTSTPSVFSYTPTGAFDPNLAGIRIETSGSFSFGGLPAPEFTISYRVRVK